MNRPGFDGGFVLAAGRPEQLLDASQRPGVAALGLSALQGMLLFRVWPVLISCLLALFVFAMRSDDRFAIWASVFYVTWSMAASGPLSVLYQHPSVRPLVRAIGVIGVVSLILALCLFPDGHFRPRWTRWLGVVAFVYAVIPAVQEFYFVDRAGADSGAQMQPILFGTLSLIGAGFVAQFIRYRRMSTPADRRHIKWVIGSGAGIFVISVQAEVVRTLTNSRAGAWLGWSAVIGLVPLFMYQVALTSAIVRHGLFEINRIMNRALVYGTVTGVLGAAYAGAVVLLSAVTRPLAGSSDLAIAISILAVATMFRPLRRRVQMIVDRRFDRSRYDAARTIEAFTARLREEIDMDALRNELIGVVDHTMRPARISIWLRDR